MNFKINDIYNGFKLLKEENIKEINSEARVFEHVKTGARLLSLYNDDDNKAFSISFKTPPADSTGIAHILEHSVLCGSRKFPTKEPFVELLKGSLNTFLNAMTFSDKTMYPVASRNQKDFINLIDVYMDAVLYPNLHKIPEIMMQEGWHYHIENKEDDITYKGVVYNEMQGAFSTPDGVLSRYIEQSLFKDTIYANESGGDPKNIPDLTQEQFKEFHNKYYHPSNSYICLYGDGDINGILKFINEEYLDGFDKQNIDAEIKVQKPFDNIETVEYEYSISADDDVKDKTYLSLNYAACESKDRETVLGLDLLEYMLLENPAAPLKKALLDADLGKDVYGQFDDSIIQSNISVVVKNSNRDKVEEFIKITNDTLGNIVENGFDEELIEASINIKEFALREAEMGGLSKGIIYSIGAMNTWLYGEDPLLYMKYEEALANIKKESKNGYFEKLIKKYFLDNNHSTILILNPKKGLGDQESERVKEKLKAFKESLSEKELQELVEKTQKLIKRQETPDTKEMLDSIPLLNLEDIPNEPEFIESEEKEIDGVKTLHQNIHTGKIAYLKMYFDATVISQEDSQYMTLLSALLGKVSTEDKHYSKLSNIININTGGIRFGNTSYSLNGDDTVYFPKFYAKAKVLGNKIPQMVDIMKEIIEKSKFDDTKRVRDIIRQLKSRLEEAIISRGHSMVSTRVMSYFSPAGRYIENISGIEYYKFISELDSKFEVIKGDISKKLHECVEKIFNKNGLIINITCEDEEYGILKENLPKLTSALEKTRASQHEYTFEELKDNEGLKTPSNVQYVAKGYNFIRLGKDYSGTMRVFKKVAGMDYLWNRVRVQGGAYGCVMTITKSGNLSIASYRDPNIKETLEAYNGIPGYLEEVKLDDRELRKYIIGTISDVDSPLSPVQKGDRAFGDYVKGLDYAHYKKEREEILATTEEDIRDMASLMRDIMRKDFYCVMGNENKIDESKDIFNKFVNVFE